MNYTDNLGINYNYIVNVTFGEKEKAHSPIIDVREKEQDTNICEIQSVIGAGKRTLKGKQARQFVETYEAYNAVVMQANLKIGDWTDVHEAKNILKQNAFKAPVLKK